MSRWITIVINSRWVLAEQVSCIHQFHRQLGVLSNRRRPRPQYRSGGLAAHHGTLVSLHPVTNNNSISNSTSFGASHLSCRRTHVNKIPTNGVQNLFSSSKLHNYCPATAKLLSNLTTWPAALCICMLWPWSLTVWPQNLNSKSVNPSTSMTKTGWNSLHWFLRHGDRKVFGRTHRLTHSQMDRSEHIMSLSLLCWRRHTKINCTPGMLCRMEPGSHVQLHNIHTYKGGGLV